jgi:hypothetical protein
MEWQRCDDIRTANRRDGALHEGSGMLKSRTLNGEQERLKAEHEACILRCVGVGIIVLVGMCGLH